MMNTQGNSFTRFHGDDEVSTRTSRASGGVMKIVRRSFEKVSEKIRSEKQPSNGKKPEEEEKEEEKRMITTVMNPNDSRLQKWNKIFLVSLIVALAIDPLFFYSPVVDLAQLHITRDTRLEDIACVFRTSIDALYVLHMVFQFRTGFVAPSSRGFGRGELNTEPKKIAIRYLSTDFIVDLLSILPLPQLLVFGIVPIPRVPLLYGKESLKWVIFCQYVPRIARIFPLSKEVTRTSGLVTQTAWAGAALNLFFYMLASHVFGAFWYLISIERQERCWLEVCEKKEGCITENFSMTNFHSSNIMFLKGSCPVIDPEKISNDKDFNFGIFAEALQSGVMKSKNFPKKLCYCFWWGLRNLSALGQNLKTSDYEGEILFAATICASGLVLFALLIGNMQKYLESTTVRLEKMRVKNKDAEQWMSLLVPNVWISKE